MANFTSMGLPKKFFLTNRFQLVYFFLLALVLIDRWNLLEHFAFRYLDDDQSIMWFGAKEFSLGHFHEPYFFGQNYNTLLESFLAVPLIRLGVAYPIALACVTSLLTLIPYILISSILFRKGKLIQALFFIALPLFLPNEFGMITAISRGYVTGVLFAGFACAVLYSKKQIRFFLFSLFSVLALYASANAIILVFPLSVLVLIENYKKTFFYFQIMLGAIPGALIWFFSNRFYVIHPEFIVHASWPLDFSTSRIKPYNWNDLFNHVMPVFWHCGFLIFPVLMAIAYFLFRQKEKSAAIGMLAGIVFLFFTLTINKVYDGYPTVFYSWGRMFVALPLLIAVFMARINFHIHYATKSIFLLLIPVSFFSIKCATSSKDVHREVVEQTEHNMYVAEITSLDTLCKSLVSVATKNKVDLIVVGTNPNKHVINYACPCLEQNLPQMFEPKYDRRTWLLKEEDTKIRNTVLFIGFNQTSFAAQQALDTNIVKLSNDPLMYILHANTLPTKELLDSLQLPMRKH